MPWARVQPIAVITITMDYYLLLLSMLPFRGGLTGHLLPMRLEGACA